MDGKSPFFKGLVEVLSTRATMLGRACRREIIGYEGFGRPGEVLVKSAQIRAARGFLDWTVRDLSERAGVPRDTLNNIETGAYAGAPETLAATRRVLERAGVEFTNGDAPGVRLRPNDEPRVRSPRRGGGRRDRREPSVTYYKAGNVSPAARKAHHRKIRSARSDDRVRVPRTGPEARQRQVRRAGVDN